jgi:hypothetical protein
LTVPDGGSKARYKWLGKAEGQEKWPSGDRGCGRAFHEKLPLSRPQLPSWPCHQALTLALNATSLRIISRVKMMVKATLRMSEM